MIQMHDVIKRGLITEKSERIKQGTNQFVFEVDMRADKPAVKRAVEKLFNVRVVDVRTMVMHGKLKRMGRWQGRQSNWKKAIVQIEEGSSLELVEGV